VTIAPIVVSMLQRPLVLGSAFNYLPVAPRHLMQKQICIGPSLGLVARNGPTVDRRKRSA
jgi:hypothetical protein